MSGIGWITHVPISPARPISIPKQNNMTTSDHDFFFGLLKISVLQLLKAQGFDKARPSTIDIVTDLYIKFLELLISEIKKLILARCSKGGITDVNFDVDVDTVALQDITQAFVNLKIVRPVDVLDVYDENPQSFSDKGFRILKDWCLNNRRLKDARKIAAAPLTALRIEEIAGVTGASGTVDNDTTMSSANMIPTTAASGSAMRAFPDYMGDLRANQEEELERRRKKTNELIEEFIDNGDTRDWIRLLIARQRLYLFHRKKNGKNMNNSLPSSLPGYSISNSNPNIVDQSIEIPDITSLPHISGLKNSVLAPRIPSKVSDSHWDPTEGPEIKSNNEFIPFSLDPSQQSSAGINVDESEWDQLSEDDIKRLKHAATLNMSLPVMHPELRLEEIVLSFENDESLDSDSNMGDEIGGTDLHEADELSENMGSNRSGGGNVRSKSNNNKDNNGSSNSNINNNNNGIRMPADDADGLGSPNDVSSSGIGDSQLQMEPEFDNDIAFDEIADMNNTFQRRASLDFGNSALY